MKIMQRNYRKILYKHYKILNEGRLANIQWQYNIEKVARNESYKQQ